MQRSDAARAEQYLSRNQAWVWARSIALMKPHWNRSPAVGHRRPGPQQWRPLAMYARALAKSLNEQNGRFVTFEVEHSRQSLNATAQNKGYSVCPRSETSAESKCGDSIFERKLKAAEPLKAGEHEELRRRLKAMGVALED
jgi:hypothetical protein